MTTRSNPTTGQTDTASSLGLKAFMRRNPGAYDLFNEPEFTDSDRAQMDEAEQASRALQARRRSK